ncbi:cation diffusion facilitator CzcD-associated flavoprotein CzcO [Mumia flava]|uniref:Cation diffusion facilitator CzcD-associated flavoprotein CzcO n=1 Tax=Mumia flava TaxID=1348852 RepID=A0A0B2BQC7_9ACTN|nr:NAD(P)/FAD-dependent oxidoreductase [Mumia flava]PJJ58081.1 cation diffusion facilitator CzcD-associated flavoprotein CzcO [Mumia flava]
MISHDILIIGTGFSGMGTAIKLEEAGYDDFVVLEKADEVGGTWRDNTYPGCECDIPSHMYSFSYDLNPTWSKSFSTQPEIWDYMRKVADQRGVRKRVHFGKEVTGARWDEERNRWEVRTSDGDVYDARVVVSGVGGLHIPNIPEIAGAESFAGPRFHSAQWDHAVDLTGKRVAVIGTGASAIQFVPIIAEQTEHLTLFQRTPPWVLPKNDKPIGPWKQKALEAVPGLNRAYRDTLYWALESRAITFNGHVPAFLRWAEKIVERHIARSVTDPETRAKLTPDYRMGCKRVLQSNTYYPTFNRDDVTLETTGIDRIVPEGVVDRDGVLHEADVIVYGTGFHVVDAFDYLDIKGRGGADLATTFRDEGVETYLGITVHRFPNLFFLLGPNTALGHNSVVFMIEQQAKYVIRSLTEMARQRADAMEPTRLAQDAFNADIQHRVKKGIWTQGGCTSWYLDSQGNNRTIWPKFTFQYWWDTRKVREHDYVFTRARERASVSA